jgi:hypothetical protein
MCAAKVSLAYVRSGSKAESLRNDRMSAFASSSGHTSARAFSSFVPTADIAFVQPATTSLQGFCCIKTDIEAGALGDGRKLLAEPCPSIRSHYRGRHEIGKIMLRLLGREGLNPQTVSAGKFAAGR